MELVSVVTDNTWGYRRKEVTLSCTLGPGVDVGKTPERTGNTSVIQGCFEVCACCL